MSDLLDTFGKRMALLRRDKNLTQTELAALVTAHGTSLKQAYVSHLERTDAYPVADLAANVARALGTTTDFLLLLTDDPMRPESQVAHGN
jgi:transcriptional regulator with XRE-family HTH domain